MSPEPENAAPPEPNSPAERNMVRGWKRPLYFLMASLFLMLGTLGAILPILPATPFLLLTSYLLIRTSPRLNAKLLRSRLFGPILVDWQVHGGVRNDVRIKAVVVVVIAVGGTMYFSDFALVPCVLVGVLAAIGLVVIFRLPAARPK